jgi:hypothetical protein
LSYAAAYCGEITTKLRRSWGLDIYGISEEHIHLSHVYVNGNNHSVGNFVFRSKPATGYTLIKWALWYISMMKNEEFLTGRTWFRCEHTSYQKEPKLGSLKLAFRVGFPYQRQKAKPISLSVAHTITKASQTR